MIFEVIEDLPEWFFWGRVLIDVSFVGLLPLEGETNILAVGGLLPLMPRRHDLPDEVVVVARTHIVFQGFRHQRN